MERMRRPRETLEARKGVGIALLTIVPALVAVGVRAVTKAERFSVLGSFIVLSAIVLAGFAWRSGRAIPRAGLISALLSLAWVPALAFGAVWALSAPMAGLGHRADSDVALYGLLLLPVMLFSTGAAILLPRLVHVRRWDPALRTASVIAVVLAAAAAGNALSRAGRPDPDAYVASLPVAGELEIGDAIQLAGRSLEYVRRPPRLARPSTLTFLERNDCLLQHVREDFVASAEDGACPRIRVRVDRRGDVAVVEVAADGAFVPKRALSPVTGEWGDLSPRAFADRLGVPVGWTVSCVLALVLAFVLAVLARRLRARAAALSGDDAVHEGRGWLALGDGRRVHAARATALPAGPVTVVLEGVEAAGGGGYREGQRSPEVQEVRAGTLRDQRRSLDDHATSLAATALTVAVFAATPLVVTAVFFLR